MNIIQPRDFRKIKDVFLNRTGKKIGELVSYKGRLYYLTYRGGGIHFMRKRRGFGIDKILLDHWIEYEQNMKMLGSSGLKIIFFYDGIREKRYFVISPSELKKVANAEEGYAKEMPNGRIETYGMQTFVSVDKLQILGFSPEDIDVVKWKKILAK